MEILDKIEMIVEQKLSSYDRKMVIDSIKNPPTVRFSTTINDTKVAVSPEEAGVKFVFDPEAYELEMALADIVDSIGGFKFKSRNKGNSFEFIVIPKTRRDSIK
jgi:hypothetical protein